MKRYLLAYLATIIVMLALDAVWLGVIAMPIYRAGIGHLMAAEVNVPAALAFYVLYVAGLMHYGVMPPRAPGQRSAVLAAGALFGLFTYATYDLTNLATLKAWPLQIVLIDILWGMFISATASWAGWAVFTRVRPAS